MDELQAKLARISKALVAEKAARKELKGKVKPLENKRVKMTALAKANDLAVQRPL
jgi:hypothetical protein